MASEDYIHSVDKVTFEQYKAMAKNNNLSMHEKIGFPDEYREDYTEKIFADILGKLPAIKQNKKKIADIGCGCDTLAHSMIRKCEENEHDLYLLDSEEMLALLPEKQKSNIHKIPGRFPKDDKFISQHINSFDAILIYSVLHTITLEDNPFLFIDYAVELLAPGGRLLLGDLANRSKRRRFFLSPKGIRMHQEYTHSNEIPKVNLQELDIGRVDDTLIFAIIQRYRMAGYETYLLPQNEDLPMATRREDILIVKPE